jgi:outer membrane protein assembly factor BamA
MAAFRILAGGSANRFAGPCLALALSTWPAIAQESGGSKPMPSFRELEAAGAIIGEIRIDNQNIFDLDNPKENNALFQLANKLHIRTRPDVIRRTLLFKNGEPLSVRLIEETERLLRSNHYLYDVRIRPVAYNNGIVDIEVATRDTWTLNPGFNFSRQGGSNSTGLNLKEYNLLGTGIAMGLARTSDVDRSGQEFTFSRNNAFDGWTTVEYTNANFDDGQRNSFTLNRPFYALDTRWAAGVSASTDERIDSIYNSSNIIGQYRHQSESGQVYGGFSKGLVDGWTHRYSVGIQYQNDAYRTDPTLPPPSQVPLDLKQVGPFVRYQAVEDDYVKVKNRNLIERAEYFALGFNSTLQLGRAMTDLGSTRNLWTYFATVSNGYAFAGNHNLLTSAYANGKYGADGGEHQFAGIGAKYYRPYKQHSLFFASISMDTVSNGDAADQLLLGGDNGLRGYPLRYQTGTHRALLSLEQRVYTDWYPFRLFRVGGAVFFDYGRAWGGMNQNTANPGWLSDVGFGLRILNDRSATGRVVHIDLAFPLNADPNIKSVQFLVKTKVTF